MSANPSPSISSLSVANLRHVSPTQHTPTRTLRLTEAEHAARTAASSNNNMMENGSPLRGTGATSSSLVVDSTMTTTSTLVYARPRSNQRNRTPMRYESPLDPDEFRPRSRQRQQEEEQRLESESAVVDNGDDRRGTRVGSLGTGRANHPARIREDTGTAVTVDLRSSKQGPSHRKTRRWTNDSFVGLAHEISKGNRTTADALIKAQKDAHLYRDIYDPKEHRSKTMQLFMQDTPEMKILRERFFECSIPVPDDSRHRRGHRYRPRRSSSPEEGKDDELTSTIMMNRIDERLRKVIIKACSTSSSTVRDVQTFEDYILITFDKTNSIATTATTSAITANNHEKMKKIDWWKDLFLLQRPKVTSINSTSSSNAVMSVDFVFDDSDDNDTSSSTCSGFYRLLLHAVCQFHGLHAISKLGTIQVDEEVKEIRARTLTVTGSLVAITKGRSRYRLLDCIELSTDTKTTTATK